MTVMQTKAWARQRGYWVAVRTLPRVGESRYVAYRASTTFDPGRDVVGYADTLSAVRARIETDIRKRQKRTLDSSAAFGL